MGSDGATNLLVFNVELDHLTVRFTWGSRVLDLVVEEVAVVLNC